MKSARTWFPLTGAVSARAAAAAPKPSPIDPLTGPKQALAGCVVTMDDAFTIRPDGSVDSVEMDRSSGLKILDAAAFKIVRMAAPYAAFPASIRRDRVRVWEAGCWVGSKRSRDPAELVACRSIPPR